MDDLSEMVSPILRGVLKLALFLLRCVFIEFIDWIGASVIRFIDTKKDSRDTRLSKLVGWLLIFVVVVCTYTCIYYFTI